MYALLALGHKSLEQILFGQTLFGETAIVYLQEQVKETNVLVFFPPFPLKIKNFDAR
jgi:hypothetical protein